MLILKVIGVAFIGLTCVITLREIKPSLAVIAGVATGVAIIVVLLDGLTGVVKELREIAIKANLDNELILTIMKIIGVGYITEFSAGICEDYGSSGIARKVQLGGKIAIFLLSLPIITNIIVTIASLAQ